MARATIPHDSRCRAIEQAVRALTGAKGHGVDEGRRPAEAMRGMGKSATPEARPLCRRFGLTSGACGLDLRQIALRESNSCQPRSTSIRLVRAASVATTLAWARTHGVWPGQIDQTHRHCQSVGMSASLTTGFAAPRGCGQIPPTLPARCALSACSNQVLGRHGQKEPKP
jgi:hypothetical protein